MHIETYFEKFRDPVLSLPMRPNWDQQSLNKDWATSQLRSVFTKGPSSPQRIAVSKAMLIALYYIGILWLYTVQFTVDQNAYFILYMYKTNLGHIGYAALPITCFRNRAHRMNRYCSFFIAIHMVAATNPLCLSWHMLSS